MSRISQADIDGCPVLWFSAWIQLLAASALRRFSSFLSFYGSFMHRYYQESTTEHPGM